MNCLILLFVDKNAGKTKASTAIKKIADIIWLVSIQIKNISKIFLPFWANNCQTFSVQLASTERLGIPEFPKIMHNIKKKREKLVRSQTYIKKCSQKTRSRLRRGL